MQIELCTIKDIASMLGLSASHVRDRLVHHPKFPAPIPHCTKPKKWLADDVKDWLMNYSRK